MSRLGHIEAAARRKLSLGSEFTPHKWQRVGPDASLLVFGREGTRRDGTRKWFPPNHEVVVTDAEEVAEAHRYVAETGNCRHCYGKGVLTASVSATDGVITKRCHHCVGSGKDTKQ